MSLRRTLSIGAKWTLRYVVVMLITTSAFSAYVYHRAEERIETVVGRGFGGGDFLGFGAEMRALEAAAADHVEAVVACDRHDPTAERLRAVVAREVTVSADERLLRGVLGIRGRAQQLAA